MDGGLNTPELSRLPRSRRVAMSGEGDVEAAVSAGREAFPAWSSMTAKSRAAIMFRFHALVEKHAEELVRDPSGPIPGPCPFAAPGQHASVGGVGVGGSLPACLAGFRAFRPPLPSFPPDGWVERRSRDS